MKTRVDWPMELFKVGGMLLVGALLLLALEGGSWLFGAQPKNLLRLAALGWIATAAMLAALVWELLR